MDKVATIFIDFLSEVGSAALLTETFLLVLLLLASVILLLVANWKILVKAGEKGWKSLIPFYGIYLQFRIAGIPQIFWLDLPVILLLPILKHMGEKAENIYTFVYYCSFAMQVLYCVYLARAFGKRTRFGVAAAFLPMIFLPILAFGPAEYSQPKR